MHYFRNDDYKMSMFNIIVFGLPQAAGRWMLGAWMVLALSGHMIPRRSLIDWVGFIAGMLWVALWAFEIVRLCGFA